MTGEDILAMIREVLRLFMADPGWTIVIFVVILLGFTLMFSRLRIRGRYVLLLILVLALIGTFLGLQELGRQGLISAVLELLKSTSRV